MILVPFSSCCSCSFRSKKGSNVLCPGALPLASAGVGGFFREDSGGLTEPGRKHWVITWCAQFTLSLAKGNKYIGWEGVWWQASKIGMSCEIRIIFFSSSKPIFFGPWFAPKLRPSVEHEFSSHKVKGHLQHPNCWFPQLVAVPQLKKYSQRKRFWKFSICEDTSVQAEGATCSVFSRDAWDCYTHEARSISKFPEIDMDSPNPWVFLIKLEEFEWGNFATTWPLLDLDL